MTRGGAIKGSSTLTVQVTGVSGIQKALRPLLDPEFTQRVDAANRKAARALAKEVRSEAQPISKHMAKSVRVKRARTGKPGWVVGSRRKVAFFWPFVIDGTKAHGPKEADALVFIPGANQYLGISSHGAGRSDGGGGWVRAKRVRGVKPNPIIDRVVARREPSTAVQMERDYLKGTGL